MTFRALTRSVMRCSPGHGVSVGSTVTVAASRAKPKQVIFHDKFADEIGALRVNSLRDQFHHLEDCITNGWGLPDEFYRLDVGKNKDRLLELTGVKHLHLHGRGSDIIVYLMEFESRVIMLRIANHAYLEDEPRGSLLSKIFGKARR